MSLRVICTSIIFLIIAQTTNAAFDKEAGYKKNSILHSEYGHLMDKYYYDYGTTVDIMKFDLQKLKAQGVKVPETLLMETYKVDKLLRSNWLALEERRKKLYKQLYFPRPMKDYLLCVKNLEDVPAVASGWVGFNSFQLELANGKRINIPLKTFIRAGYREKYSYNCEPSPAIFVYGKRSERHSTVSEINLPEDIKGDVKVIVSGLDCDKGGKPSRIAIYVYGTLIYEGNNVFRKNGWTEQVLNVPAKVFQRKNKHVDAKNNLSEDLAILRNDIEIFKENAIKVTDNLKKQAYPYLKNQPKISSTSHKKIDWSKKYVRAMDISNKLYGEDKFVHPGNYMNIEYVVKACKSIGINLTTLEILRLKSNKEMYEVVKDFAQNTTIPFLLWSSNQFFINRDMISYSYYGNRKKLSSDTDKFLNTFAKLPNFAGIQLDEPTITEKDSHNGKLLDNTAVKKAYSQYIQKRKDLLLKNCVKKITSTPFVGKPKTGDEQVLWMEWQIFKKAYMADHFSWLYKNIEDRDFMASIVIMNKNKNEPQICSYPSMGKALPYIGTDLYGNGDVSESFAIQLLKSSTNGQAIMWPGAGYSCKSPETFRRTTATALTHADGIHMWTYNSCSKYRDANYFWRYGGTRQNCDDRGRNLLNNWDPAYWYILKDMYGLAAKTEKYLVGRKSLAKAAVLFSERTAIARSAANQTVAYWQHCLNIYSDLIGAGIPLESCFVETLDKDKLNRYKYLILSEASVMTSAEVEKIKEWVKKGGLLIASGSVATKDQWGRKLKASVFEDMFKKKAYGEGRAVYISEKDIARRVERIADSGFSGRGIDKYKQILREFIAPAGKDLPVEINGLPDGVELQIQKNDDCYLINLVDWFNKRTIEDYSMIIKEPGEWLIMLPAESEKFIKVPANNQIQLNEFKIYNMIIIKRVK
jgi:hypothetical protein